MRLPVAPERDDIELLMQAAAPCTMSTRMRATIQKRDYLSAMRLARALRQ